MGSAFDVVDGQPTAVAVLTRALADGRVASAYLFEGPSGVGKRLAALALAKASLGEAAWRRVDIGAHPDARVFEPRADGNRNIKVQQLREQVLPHADFAPFEGASSFLVFPEADISFPQDHAASANVLLKTLEEPRAGVTFILTAERPERLLPTIRSRCQRLRFRALSAEVLDRILATHDVPEDRRASAIALADGRADRALAFAEEGQADALIELALRLDDALAGSRPGTLVDLAGEVAKHDDTDLVLDTLCRLYRDAAALWLGRPWETLALRHLGEELEKRARRVGAQHAAERVARIQNALADDLRRGNATTVMDGLLHQLR